MYNEFDSNVSRDIVKEIGMNFNKFDMKKVIFQKKWLSNSIIEIIRVCSHY